MLEARARNCAMARSPPQAGRTQPPAWAFSQIPIDKLGKTQWCSSPMAQPKVGEHRNEPSPPVHTPHTCGMAVAGLAGSLLLPAVVVLPALLAAGPGRVVATVATVPPVAGAAEQLRVVEAFLRAAAAVASWGGTRRGGWGPWGSDEGP